MPDKTKIVFITRFEKNQNNTSSSISHGVFAEDETNETGYNSFELSLWDSPIGRWMIAESYNQYHSANLGMENCMVVRVDGDRAYYYPSTNFISPDSRHVYVNDGTHKLISVAPNR
ncbi:MAG: hypothetical protein JXR58_09465 [Bacteroidales bacterium]|nr:hypothetical protein [Bacteroidales bacterium]